MQILCFFVLSFFHHFFNFAYLSLQEPDLSIHFFLCFLCILHMTPYYSEKKSLRAHVRRSASHNFAQKKTETCLSVPVHSDSIFVGMVVDFT
ncbi:hypothetical protein CBW42_11305 [Butyricicoccus porcorum]|uniref:Uncharacterized protein n=1 Tax=Butyricicoccus porcorum TaxID=1945634 RepID=A0A252F1Y5_9FIRM|nr:hypothetical protein CBW42_11305 [Butyricicoccus porcorum]